VGCVRHPECWWGCREVTRHSDWPEDLAWRCVSLQRGRTGRTLGSWGCQTWRQTATRRPCTITSWAGSTIGA